MKIQLRCASCQTLLAVAPEAAGKWVRCPRCNHLTLSGQPSEPDTETTRPHHDTSPDKTAPDFAVPLPGQRSPTAQHPAPAATTGRYSDGALSLLAGTVGILFSFSCWCVVPALLIVNLIGLHLAIKSQGRIRTAGLITNGLAVLIQLIILVWFLT